ncbi:NAD-dependent epimerase/dehydratase family protein [Euzebya tangerina]|uniref:NAD-dependent epimerase/dehydratase family protein n=1 Tax=Euzebya tangerina TaxID=591198 RepID=UPI0013C2F0A4|nr:NAD-dependent epimerase/dehydratase family protein [Euzebya tangerina]
MAGSTGVLGRRVVPALIAEGHTVTAVARGPAKAAVLRELGAEPVAVDLFDRAAVVAATAGHDVVMNLATAIPSSSAMLRPSAWEMTSRLRTEGARNLVEGALATGASRYVQEALGFVYPDHGDRWIDEGTGLEPAPYAEAVLAAEASTRHVTEAGGVGVALRFGMFYSADSAQTADLIAAARRGLLTLPGRASAHQPWIHVDDAAAAVVAALDAPAGAYNVVEDQPLTHADHAELLSELLDRRVRRTPDLVIRSFARLGRGVGEVIGMVSRSQRVSNRRLRDQTSWRPTFGHRRDGWSAVLRALDTNSGA